MERYTEYHCGVPVIKDKDKHIEAVARLAAYEDTDLLPNEMELFREVKGLIGKRIYRFEEQDMEVHDYFVDQVRVDKDGIWLEMLNPGETIFRVVENADKLGRTLSFDKRYAEAILAKKGPQWEVKFQ